MMRFQLHSTSRDWESLSMDDQIIICEWMKRQGLDPDTCTEVRFIGEGQLEALCWTNQTGQRYTPTPTGLIPSQPKIPVGGTTWFTINAPEPPPACWPFYGEDAEDHAERA